MRLLLISNRLPVTVKREQNSFNYEHSVGGLVTGINDYLEYSAKNSPSNKSNYLWVGWPGITVDIKNQKVIQKELLDKFNSLPVFLPEKQIERFYHGFCNKTLWPLFHYFPLLTAYDDNYWNSYKSVNETFYNTLLDVIKEDDIVWIHDYHLMLLPALLRKKHPNIKIGFFLHIPFPAFEVFRLLPKNWREKILQGLLGADLLGFHAPEYTQYFLHCVQRILGFEHNLGKILIDHRIIKADTFPMGINFDKFYNADSLPAVSSEIDKFKKTTTGFKIILSIDRLDYTKGILNRLYGYERFLETNPEWLKKVILILVVVPSRTGIEHYQQIKKQVDEYVGKINGKFGDVNWTPILYQYKFFEFPTLSALYKISDIALVTPLRDGMNLIAKEYIASRKDRTGVLILSEMAGVAKELGEALIINPNSIEAIADSLKSALLMKEENQIYHNQIMQSRLKNYNIVRWVDDFLYGLQKICAEQMKIKSKIMTVSAKNQVVQSFKSAKQKILFLDYDGTLSPLVRHPDLAKPSEDCLNLLTKLTNIPGVDLVLISGRSKNTLQNWFQIKNLNFVAEHGAWHKFLDTDWQTLKPLTSDWKPQIIAILQTYADRVPGTFIEDKDYSVCWHYRNADPEFATIRIKELMDDLVGLTANSDLQVMQGNKIIEVKNAGISKGTAAGLFLSKKEYDFILAIGDDLTDEDLFQVLPPQGFSIKVGAGRSHAKYNLSNSGEVIELLKEIINVA
jgi:trehalose 6-phosphate synthase/phosphatase